MTISKPRASREETLRASQERKKSWVPPSHLDNPPPPAGYSYKWIRYHDGRGEDTKNLISAFQQGYEPVKMEELPHGFRMDAFNEGRYEGVVRKGDLMLCKLPLEIKEDRTRQIQERTDLQRQATQRELGSGSNQYIRMEKPTIADSTSVGRPEIQED